MPIHLLRKQKLKELTFKQVHALAVESLSAHLELKSSGSKSSPEKIWDVLLSAAANNSSIDRECDELEGCPSANTVRGVLSAGCLKGFSRTESDGNPSQPGSGQTLEAKLLEKAPEDSS